ncbi:Ig-like domain repeat protein [Granulicella sp. dw_53]|uniref:NHL domain-containing protein n=1 Tax=Granulicella sp. dw_53 TaxID=2719792 RepID=UPI001BD32FF5|nr:Ig-like domain repeat protein [Granulicella sp. dw_53]
MNAQTAPINNIQATMAPLASPAGIAYDRAGNLYIADLRNNIIRRVDLAGIITTVAGTGEQGYAGDDGPATKALLDSPTGIAVDASNNIYIADTHNNRIRKVTGGNISTIAGTGLAGFSGDSGIATLAALNHPAALAVDASGTLYIADTDNHRIRKISGGTITTIAGSGDQSFSGDGVAVAAWLDSPNGVAADASGNIYIADTHNQRIRIVNNAGTISTLAGNGDKAYAGDGGQAVDASLARPRGLAIDASGNIYIADSDNHRIRFIATTGNITSAAGNGSQGMAGDGGPAINATLDTPRAPSVQANGVFALSDTNNQIIREVGLDGIIHTIAGVSPQVSGGESLILDGPSTVAYGSGSLTATFSNANLTATGQVALLDITTGSTQVGSATWNGNTAAISTSTLSAGTHRLVLNYDGDAQNLPITSSVFVLTVSTLPTVAMATGVSLQYGQIIPTITGTLSGVLPQDAGKITAVFTTTATATSPVGQYPITVALAGSAAGNYTVTLSTGSGSVLIAKAASRITLSSTNATPSVGSTVTLTAQVNSTTSGVPTGNVIFLDGTTVLATTTLNSTGSAAYTSSAFAVGPHNITAVYSGDTNFTASTSTATIVSVVLVPDFVFVSTGSSTQSVYPGQTAVYNFALQPLSGSSLSGISFTVSGLPEGATAVFNPGTISAGSSATSVALSIKTAGLHAANTKPTQPLHLPLLSLSATMFLVPLWRNKRIRAILSARRCTLLTALFAALVGTAILGGLTGCGSSGFFGQPTKTYSITVTASAVGTTTSQHNAVVTLIVQ